jgi:hypothetical protein
MSQDIKHYFDGRNVSAPGNGIYGAVLMHDWTPIHSIHMNEQITTSCRYLDSAPTIVHTL